MHNKKLNYSPIALFVYNRLDLCRKTVESLSANHLAKQSDLIIFSDGPKSDKDAVKIKELREYLKTIDPFRSTTLIEQQRNLGLAQSIINGVGRVLSDHGKVIVLEDDMVCSPYFLNYMNDALNLYENEKSVASIHGYIYPVKKDLPESFFIKGADCWGWATWKKKWMLFESDGKKLLSELQRKKLISEFNFNDSFLYSDMLKKQILGKNNSWAILWYASAFLNNMLTLYPGQSYIQNIGVNSSGTHYVPDNDYAVELVSGYCSLKKIPIQEDRAAKSAIEEFFRNLKSNNRLYSIFKRLISKLFIRQLF